MVTYKLTFVDTISVQRFIFGSNVLKHIIGASELVHKTTNDWVFSNLATFGGANVDSDGNIAPNLRFPDHELHSELIYAGGGNALILFAQGYEKQFALKLSMDVLTNAPGLDIVIVHEDVYYDEENKIFIDFKEKIKNVILKAGIKKQNRQINASLAGLGFTYLCPYTGSPATGRHYSERISTEIQKKFDAEPDAERRLKNSFGSGREYFNNFDAIAGEKKGSYIAVVHSDGTDMGKRIEKVLDEAPDNKDECIHAMRELSDSIKRASTAAMQSTIDRLDDLVQAGKISRVNGCLPIRPIVFGGDDVTFVCDGMLGLSMGAYHLKQLESLPLSDEAPIYGRTGVAIVKSHFPFSQAYQLAENLCQSARTAAKEAAVNDIPPAMIDWYFSSSGPVLDLKRIRDEKYFLSKYGKDMELMMRPVVVWGATQKYKDWRTWDVFSGLVSTFNGEVYKDKRSKLKGLLGILSDSKAAFGNYLTNNQLKMPEISTVSNLAKSGWDESLSLYHDALEAMDFFTEF